MAVNDPTATIVALRAELEAAVAVIDPELTGLNGLSSISNVPLTDPSLNALSAGTLQRQRFRELIEAVLSDLAKLERDWANLLAAGYPQMPSFPVVATVFQELQAELAAIEAAIALFPKGFPETGDFNPDRSVKTP